MTKFGARCKRSAAFFTHRAPQLIRLPWHTRPSAHIPLNSGAPSACSAAHGWAVRTPVFKSIALRSLVTAPGRERRTRYCGVSGASAIDRSRLGGRWRGQAYEAIRRARRLQHPNGSRQLCRHDGRLPLDSGGCRSRYRRDMECTGVEPRQCLQPARVS